ncbi:glucosyltransferase domain-containing protein [Escherichia coli]|uniref:glucosyltransferase domain-containing protein n=1 Tax=Escherichia coli TaxID=562 RepID=UPI00244E4F8B|nr:glucosyltransferase domain-containing protein [Escherichia coli]
MNKFKDINLIWITLLCLTFVMPFLLSDIQYRDDAFRSLTMLSGWRWGGRILTDLSLSFLSMNKNGVFDISPLPLVISIVCVSITIYYAALSSRIKVNIFSIIAFSSIFISPFSIQSIAYKYDVLPMTLGICLSIIAISFNSKTKYLNIIVPVAMLLASLSLYQPCSNLYIGLYAVNCIFRIWGRDEYIKYTIKTFIIYSLSISLYYIVVMKLLGFSTQRAEIVSIGSFLSKSLHTFHLAIKQVMLFWNEFSSPIVLLCLASLIFVIISNINKNNVLPTIISLSVLIFSIIGPLVAIGEDYMALRIVIGANCIYFALVLSLYLVSEKYGFRAVVILPILLSMMFCYIFSSAIKQQRNFENNVLIWLSYDLQDKVKNLEEKKVYISNTMPTQTTVQKMVQNFMFLRDVNKYSDPMYSPAAPWMSRPLISSLGIPNVVQSWGGNPREIMVKVCDSKVSPLVSKANYEIYENGDDVLVFFKGKYSKDQLCPAGHW